MFARGHHAARKSDAKKAPKPPESLWARERKVIFELDVMSASGHHANMKMRCAEQSADWGPRERDEVGGYGAAGGCFRNSGGPGDN